MSGIGVVWAVMKNDLRLILARPSSTILAVLIPVNFLILFSLFALGGARVPVGMVQADSGAYSATMVQALNQTNTFRITAVPSQNAAQRLIDGQQSVATINIVPGFSKAIASGADVTLPVTIDNLNADFANDIRRALPLGILNFYEKTTPSVLPMGWHEVDEYPHDVSFFGYLAVSIETVALLLGGILLTSRGVAGEWEQGTIKELKLSPAPTWALLTGKILTGYLTSMVSAALIFGILTIFGIHPQNWGLLIASSLVILLIFATIGLAVGMMAKSQFVVYPLVLGVSLPLFFISGGFGPVSWSTPAMLWVARVFPVIYANTILQRAIHGFWPLDVGVGVAWLVFAIWGLAAVGLSIWLYRRATLAK